MRVLGFAAALTIIAAPALAADANPGETAGASKPAKPEHKPRRCVEETPTGTAIPKRVCHTEEEWAELQRLAEVSHQRDQDQRTFCTRGGRDC